MGFDWGHVLDSEGREAAEAYDEAVADALYQDHPRQAPTPPPGGPIDQGDEKLNLPFDEI